MDIQTNRASALRQRVLQLASAVRERDGASQDLNPAAGHVRLRNAGIELGHDHLNSADLTFDEHGVVDLKMTTHHDYRLGGEFRARVHREGTLETYRLAQDGYHGDQAFRAELTYDSAQETFLKSEIRDGAPRGLEAVKEMMTTPVPLAAAGLGAASGLFTSFLAFGGAHTALSVGAGAVAGVGLAALMAISEGEEHNS